MAPGRNLTRKALVLGICASAAGLAGCLGGDDESEPPAGDSGQPATELPANLPPADATTSARRAALVPPLGRIPSSSVRLSAFAPGKNTNHFDATVVTYLPEGWRVVKPRSPYDDTISDVGFGPDLYLERGSRMVAVGVCANELTGSVEQPGLDEPTGAQAARDAAGRYYQPPMGSLRQPAPPPRLAPGVYRGAHLVVVGFQGGGCLYLADPQVPDPTAHAPNPLTGSPNAIERRLKRARTESLSSHLVEVAMRTTGYWGRSPRLPASNRRAEAIARRAQRATMAASRLRYEEQLVFCVDGSSCQRTEADDRRLVERERASGYVLADYTGDYRSFIVRRGDAVRESDSGDCWSPDPYRGSYDGGFLFHGYFSDDDDQAAFFPPLHRWQLTYEPVRPAGADRTELRWRSYFDRGRAIVDNATLRLVRMDRVVRATIRVWRKRTVSFAYPARLHPVSTKQVCTG